MLLRWIHGLLAFWTLLIPAQSWSNTLGAWSGAVGACQCADTTHTLNSPAPKQPSRRCCGRKQGEGVRAVAQAKPSKKPCCPDPDTIDDAPSTADHDCACLSPDDSDHDSAYAPHHQPLPDLSLDAPVPQQASAVVAVWRAERRPHALPKPRAPDFQACPLYCRLCVWLI